MARFNQTFNWLYSRLPFADTNRPKLRAWAEAVRRQLMLDAPGWAVSFDGVDDCVDVLHNAGWGANQGLNITGAISIAFWAYWRNTGGDVDFICSKGAGYYEIQTAPGGLVANALRFIPAAGVWLDTAADKFPANQWNHVVVTWKDEAPRGGNIYVNGADAGAIVTHDDLTFLGGSTSPWFWGQRGDETYPFKGYLDEVAVWGRVITADEVAELYAAGAGLYVEALPRKGFGYELRALYHLDEGRGVAVADASPTRADGALTNGAAWTEGIIAGLPSLQTAANRVYDACFLPTATGVDLEKWGDVFGVRRVSEDETDPAYRERLLDVVQARGAALTVRALKKAVNDTAVDWHPPLHVIGSEEAGTLRVDEYYDRRVEDGLDVADTWSLGDRWGLEYADLLTVGLVLDRIPTAAEAKILADEIRAVKAVQTRAFVVNALANGETPGAAVYRVRAGDYKVAVAPWLRNDEFTRRSVTADPFSRYDRYGGDDAWEIIEVVEGSVLHGDAAAGEPLVPHVILPKLVTTKDLLFNERDIYMEATLKVAVPGVGLGWAGAALRVTFGGGGEIGTMFALAFWLESAVSKYALKYWDGSSWSNVLGPTTAPLDMTAAYRDVQLTLEGQAFTLIVDGDVWEEQETLGSIVPTPGRWGFITVGQSTDLYVDDYRYW